MTKLLTAALLGVLLLTPSWAQNEKGSDTNTQAVKDRFYRLDFSVREVEGERTINSREYSTILSNGHNSSSIRVGAHVPASMAGGGWQDVYLGVSIDCKNAEEIGDEFQLNVRSDISTMTEGSERGVERPITRNNSWQSDVILPLRKPTLLFSSDDPASKRKMQLVLTVMPVH